MKDLLNHLLHTFLDQTVMGEGYHCEIGSWYFTTNLYSHGYDIFEHYNVALWVRFATSKTRFDIKYNKLGIRVASRVAERLKT